MKKIFIYGLLLASTATYSADVPGQDFLRIRIIFDFRDFPDDVNQPRPPKIGGQNNYGEPVVMPVDNRRTITCQDVIGWFNAQYKGTSYYVKRLRSLATDVTNSQRTIQSYGTDFNTPIGETSGLNAVIGSRFGS